MHNSTRLLVAILFFLVTVLGTYVWFMLHKTVYFPKPPAYPHPRAVLSAHEPKDQAPIMADIEILVPPSISFSLAAIVRTRTQQSQEQRPQEYAIVHDRPPRGWWLPGGGIEHRDATPVDAAIRESVEEAGSPSLLPLLTLSPSKTEDGLRDLRSLPSMTHLISLEQTPGRIRFIFRGEWIDDSVVDQNKSSKESRSILKPPPGDDESIEAKWITWDEVLQFRESKRAEMSKSPPPVQSKSHPWLRGHEPITFFGMLEFSSKDGRSVPGLPVHRMDIHGEHNDYREAEATGAFFGRMMSASSDESSNAGAGLTSGRRAALLTHLKCRLLVYNENQQTFAIDAATNAFPSSLVKNQNEMTLKQLVAVKIADFVSFHSEDNKNKKERYQAGLLRMEHIVHDNGKDATLTVFPFVCLRSVRESANEAVSWVSVNEISDNLERRLADAVIGDQRRNKYLHLDILRDHEGRRRR
mmetsp:Transcript_32694/g.79153  ORF Transcript_32694/g.79153 Transcript_32694/m.79153 type:complete len:469 (-) Transcript_32694:159-1565(-)